jgi:D-arabinose 1-dehydrogenase-like Zn-dependent alcohol dehydrogenase
MTPAEIVGLGAQIISSSVGVTHELKELYDLYVDRKIKTHLSKIGRLSEINSILHELVESKYLGRAVISI